MAWKDKEKEKEYNKKYRQANKEKMKGYNKRYRLANREEIKKKKHEYYLVNKEEILKQKHEYQQANKRKISEQHCEYRQANKEKCTKTIKCWRNKHPEKVREMSRRHYNKRRNLDSHPLNKWFKGCEGHHINFNDIIYIPRELHKSIPHCLTTGRNMSLINNLAYQFLMGNYVIYK